MKKLSLSLIGEKVKAGFGRGMVVRVDWEV